MDKEDNNKYHHGDLKQALMDAAINVIYTQGVGAISLRKLAAKTDVSHTACYRHFSNKDALLAALVTHGFEIFLDALQSATQKQQHALDMLHALGRAYLQFAQNNTAYYQLMFNGVELLDITEQEREQLEKARSNAFNYFVSQIEQAQQLKYICQSSAQDCAFFMWSSLHGACGLSALFSKLSLNASESELELETKEAVQLESRLESILEKIYSGIAPQR